MDRRYLYEKGNSLHKVNDHMQRAHQLWVCGKLNIGHLHLEGTAAVLEMMATPSHLHVQRSMVVTEIQCGERTQCGRAYSVPNKEWPTYVHVNTYLDKAVVGVVEHHLWRFRCHVVLQAHCLSLQRQTLCTLVTHYIILYCTILHYTTSLITILVVNNAYTALHCTAPHYSTLHYTGQCSVV